jgi:hypothetical protein
MKFADERTAARRVSPGRLVLWRRMQGDGQPASSARTAKPRPRATRPGAQHPPIRSTPSSSAPQLRRSRPSSGGPDSRPRASMKVLVRHHYLRSDLKPARSSSERSCGRGDGLSVMPLVVALDAAARCQ